MNSNVIIKSIPNGIRIQLNSECSFSDIIEELGKKFMDSANFFKGSSLAVTFSGRQLIEEEEQTLIKIMEQNGEFSVLYVITSDENGTENARSINHNLTTQDTSGFGTTYLGTITRGEHLQFECGVVVLGDVEPGALIRARGNVIILGGLYGSVNLDIDESEDRLCFVYALDMNPERIKIANERFYSEKSKWSIKTKNQPKIAFLKDGKIEIKPVERKTFADLT